MGDNLPPLTERIGSGPEGGLEFERLMHQLFLRNAERNDYFYEITGLRGGDYFGVDGLVRKDFPGLEGSVGIQFKWLWDLSKGSSKKSQIETSLQKADRNFEGMDHWVLVTPKDFTKAEKQWFDKLGFINGRKKRKPYRVHHFGQQKVEQMLRDCPSLFVRYFPEASHEFSGISEYFDFKRLLRQYKDRTVIDYKDLRLFGIPHKSLKEQHQQGEVLLKDVFVPLNLIPWGEEEATKSVSTRALLESTRPKVILGDPGSGKSTLLYFVSLLYSGGAVLENAEIPSQMIPLFISVREYIRFLKSDPGMTFIDYLVAKARKDYCLQHIHPYFFESLLLMGEAIVLFDGLDEVYKETSRARISRAIEAFHDQYPNCPIWITSRIVGYSGNVMLSNEIFSHYLVAKFDEIQRDRFIENWYRVQIPEKEGERADRIESLKRAVQRSRGVKRLSSNPLLLTLMALIHHYEATLPQDRSELYDKCVEMLLKTWQAVRDEESGQLNPLVELNINPDQQKNLLARLSLWMQERNEDQMEEEARGLAPEGEVLEQLIEYRIQSTRGEIDRSTAKYQMQIFLDYIRSRSGLLVERGEGQFAFFHLSFQEYLAAYQLFEDRTLTFEDHLNFFIKHMGNKSWEEVLLLLLYKLSKTTGLVKFTDLFISTLIRHLEEREEPSWWLTLGRAIRDNLDFTQKDCRMIVSKLISCWLEEPAFEGKWFQVIEDISMFSDQGRLILMEILEERRKEDNPKNVVAILHMTEKLFGLPEGCSQSLKRNPSLDEMIPDLFAFIDNEEISGFLREKASLKEWVEYEIYKEKTLTRPEYFENIFKNADEKTQIYFLLSRWKRILDEISKRNSFAEMLKTCDHYLLKKGGILKASMPMASVRLPLPTFLINPFLDFRTEKSEFGGKILLDKLFYQKLVNMTKISPVFMKCFREWSKNLIASLIVEFISEDWVWDGKMPSSIKERTEQISSTKSITNLCKYFIDHLVDERSPPDNEYRNCPVVSLSSRFIYSDIMPEVDPTIESLIKYCRGEIFSIYEEFNTDIVRKFGVEFGKKIGAMFSEKFGIEFGDSLRIPSSITSPGEIVKTYESDRLWHAILREDTWLAPLNKRRCLKYFTVTNPCAIPFVCFLLQMALRYAHSLSIRRDYLTEGKSGRLVRAVRVPIEELVAFSWGYLVDSFFTTRERLIGIKGSIFLSYAAYVSLLTGIELKGDNWNRLLRTIDHANPLLQISYLLYEICNFRDVERNSQELVKLLESMKHYHKELLEAGGLMDRGKITVRFNSLS